MKKVLIVALYGLGAFILSDCSPSKKAVAAPEPAKVTYDGSITAVMESFCSPCHIPSKGGNKKSFDNYANVKANIDEILRRVQMEPGQRGFMPARQPKLNDGTIALLKQWQAEGLVEK